MPKVNYVYRITDECYDSIWTSNYRDAVKEQKNMYALGAERVQIAKEYLG